MKKHIILFASICLTTLALSQTTQTEVVQLNTITTAVPFVMISGNAVELASGNLGVVSSTFYHESAFTSNPALLANGHEYISGHHGYMPWLRSLVPDIHLQSHTWAGTINKRHAVGFHFKHFSLGNITFTDAQGGTIGDFNPTEYVLQANYAHWFPFGLSVGAAGKYIHSNLTGGINVGGADTRPAQAGAADLGLSYRKQHQVSEKFGVGGTFGFALNNIGNKVSYTNTSEKDFLPTNMMLGIQLNLGEQFGKVRLEHDIGYQITKLLVPTPPIYDRDPYLNANLPPGDTLGSIGHPSNSNPNFGSIQAGQDPNVGVFRGMFNSFNDAPGGTEEEWNEVIHQVAHEFRFIYNDVFMFAFRQGYFHEHESKGNRRFVSLGGSVGGGGFRFDFGGWIPLQDRSPLANTLFASVSYRLILKSGVQKARYPKWNPTASYNYDLPD